VNTDFLCEKTLAKLNPNYSELVKNTAFVLCHTLEKYKLYFPEFTDHTILHSLQVVDFCNKLIGDNISLLNEDEIYVLLMSAYLHDCGMGISKEDYKLLYSRVVSDEFRLAHPNNNIKETIRSFHQTFSKNLIYKYAKLFEIPTEKHIKAIATVSGAHRKIDLFDEEKVETSIVLDNGNVIHLPYLAALIRLADELDIAADRNIGVDESGKDTIFKLMHRSITHLHILKDKFVLDVQANDPALFEGISSEIKKLDNTLKICEEVIRTRTPFRLTQKTVEINRIEKKGKSITVLDSDLGTDDACALLLLKILPRKPDYIVASYGNTSLQKACENAVILKNYLSLEAKIVKGLPAPDDKSLPINEKGTFHGSDGLAGCGKEMGEKLGLTQSDFSDYISFDALAKEISSADEVTYITIGTLTNLNYLISNEETRKKLTGIYIMGGGIREFNCSNNTEFNFSKDPESVKNILSSGLNITLFPLDVTNHQTLSKEDIKALEDLATFPEYIKLLKHNLKANSEYNNIPFAVIHDILPILFLSYPQYFTLQDMKIITDEFGHTEISPLGEAVHICTSVKEGTAKRFLESAFLCGK